MAEGGRVRDLDPLPAHHLIAITPNAGFEPGLWAVRVRDTVKDRSGRPVNSTNATWTVEIGEPRARPDDPGPARNTLKLKFTTEVDPATYADGIVVEKQVAGGWEEEPRGSATIAPSAHGGSVNEIGLLPLSGWERGATYRVRVTEAIRDVRGLPLTNAEDFSFTVPKSGPLETRHEPRRPVAQASAQAAAEGPAFPGGQALGWHGHWTDPVTGLIYMRHRWYDPRTGTFLSPDPLEDIDSPNQYLFGAGRPHEVVDPLGLQSSPTGDARDQLRQAQAALQELTPDRPDITPSRGEASIGRAFGRHAGEVGVVVGGMAATAAGEAIVFYTQEKAAELGFRVVIRIAGRSIQRAVRTLSEAERIAKQEGAARVRFEAAASASVVPSDVAGSLAPRISRGVAGRIESAFAKIEPQHLGGGSPTTPTSRRAARGLGQPSDDAGHLIATRLGGPGAEGFVVPQNPGVNRGAFRVFEAGIAEDVKAGKEVFVRVVPRYSGSETRPFEILYQVRVDGSTTSRVFPNPP